MGSTGGVATCGKCGDGFYNDGAKGCKATCTRSACREGLGAGANNPGHGSKDSDCCGGKGATGCDVGYMHSIVKAADWAKIPGGRPAGFSTCNTLSSHVGNTCCTKVDPTVRAKACVLSVCREHGGAGRNNPGKGKRDGDCCGAKGSTGCDVGYVHSLMNDADWAKIGGRTAGLKLATLSTSRATRAAQKGWTRVIPTTAAAPPNANARAREHRLRVAIARLAFTTTAQRAANKTRARQTTAAATPSASARAMEHKLRVASAGMAFTTTAQRAASN